MTSTINPTEKFRSVYLGRKGKRCRLCNGSVFSVASTGSMHCTACSPATGGSILTLIATGDNKSLIWREFDEDFDGGTIQQEQATHEASQPITDDVPGWFDRFYEMTGDSPRSNPHSHPPQRAKAIDRVPISDGRRCRLLSDQFTISGVTFPAGREFIISYRFYDRFGELRANLLRTDGGAGISCLPFDRLEVLQ